MENGEDTKLTKEVTVAQYRKLEANGDRVACGQIFVQRFQERYFEPTVDAPSRHGFTLMAIGCLVIETLECFYQGEKDSNRKSGAIFESFFKRQTGLQDFGGDDNWFYKKIRCGILHQAETVGGWRIRRSGRLLDKQLLLINGKLFILQLKQAVSDYANQLQNDEVLWANFRKKMNAVCENCARP